MRKMNMGLALPQWVIFVMTTLTFKFGLANGSAGVLLRRQARRSCDPSSGPPQLMQISRALPAACGITPETAAKLRSREDHASPTVCLKKRMQLRVIRLCGQRTELDVSLPWQVDMIFAISPPARQAVF
jgi:hypothetical protein